MSVRYCVFIVLIALASGGCARDFVPATELADVSVKDVPASQSDSSETYEQLPPVITESAASGVESISTVPAVVRSVEGADPLEPYVLDTGDRLRIFIYGQPNLSRLYTVDQAGKISVPLIGQVVARGKTTSQLEHAIANRLGAEFVKDPVVTVDIHQNRPFFILGEVRNAGQFPFVSGMTIETAVAIAGGYSERASQRSFRVSRRVNGYVEEIEATSGFSLQPGDTIYVFERYF